MENNDDDIIERFRMYSERFKQASVAGEVYFDTLEYIIRLRKERDEARLQTGRILNEIDCRIEHGAESNGHLEAIHNLFKENTND